jgi:chemotaxis signal transduction protein
MPWAVVQLRNQWFAIATRDMREMLMLPEVAAVPNVPDYVRGVINLRERVMPVVDLRKRIGMTSAIEETDDFCNLMLQREQDHRNWLAELEASVKQGRSFDLTTDPHQCAFGKWYDTYRAENVWVAGLLKKFDRPHQRIHGVAARVKELAAAGKHDQCIRVIADARDTVLALMIKLFSDLKKLVREVQRETAVILTASGKTFAVSVDSAVSVEKLVPGSVASLPAGVSHNPNAVVQRVAKRGKQEQPLLLIETDRILSQPVDLQ